MKDGAAHAALRLPRRWGANMEHREQLLMTGGKDGRSTGFAQVRSHLLAEMLADEAT